MKRTSFRIASSLTGGVGERQPLRQLSSLAPSVEMAFLGLTLSMGLKGQGKAKSIAAAFVGPLGIVLGATLGGLLADALSSNPIYLTFLLSFGTSALLFMVAEELLLEAHEKGEHVWWVDLQLYTGFYASIVMGKVLG